MTTELTIYAPILNSAESSDGVHLIGYCSWSFTDLLSWLNGYQKRYGFVYINRDEEDEKDLKRIRKKSFYWYQNVIETNGKVYKVP